MEDKIINGSGVILPRPLRSLRSLRLNSQRVVYRKERKERGERVVAGTSDLKIARHCRARRTGHSETQGPAVFR